MIDAETGIIKVIVSAGQRVCCSTILWREEMGLERRGNNLYYYRKERRGDRVVSVYQGKGEIATLMHTWDKLRRQEGNSALYELEEVRRKNEEVDEVLNRLAVETRAMETALFLINGYREHSRQWRKQRTKK